MEGFIKKNLEDINIHILPTKRFFTQHIRISFVREVENSSLISPKNLLSSLFDTENNGSRLIYKNKVFGVEIIDFQIKNYLKGTYDITEINLILPVQSVLGKRKNILNVGIENLAKYICSPYKREGIFKYEIIEKKLEEYNKKLLNYGSDIEFFLYNKFVGHINNMNDNQIPSTKILNNENMFDCYHQFLQDSKIHIHVIGEVEVENIKQFIERKFKVLFLLKKQRDIESRAEEPLYSPRKVSVLTKEKSSMKVHQSKIMYILQIDRKLNDVEYCQLFVLNNIIESRLREEIRYKRNMAYNIKCNIEGIGDYLYIRVDTDYKYINKVFDIIKREVILLSEHGYLSEKEIDVSVKGILHYLKFGLDLPEELIQFNLEQYIKNRYICYEKMISYISLTNVQEIAKLSRTLKENYIHVIAPEEENMDVYN